RKFVPAFTPSALRDAARAALRAGARFPCRGGEDLDGLLTRLEPAFFDPDVDTLVTNKTPGAGQDILAASANNLYDGVTMEDVEGWSGERYGLNSRLVKRDGSLVEEVYRIGGKYGAQIGRIVDHFREAMPLAPAPMRAALTALIQFYVTGDNAD